MFTHLSNFNGGTAPLPPAKIFRGCALDDQSSRSKTPPTVLALPLTDSEILWCSPSAPVDTEVNESYSKLIYDGDMENYNIEARPNLTDSSTPARDLTPSRSSISAEDVAERCDSSSRLRRATRRRSRCEDRRKIKSNTQVDFHNSFFIFNSLVYSIT